MSLDSKQKRRAKALYGRNSKSIKVENSVEGAATYRHIDGGHVKVTTSIHPKAPENPVFPQLAPVPISAAAETDVEVDTEQPSEKEKETQV